MSIGIATMGMFNPCCGGAPGGGGAPPYRQNTDEIIRPRIVVSGFEIKTTKTLDDYLSKIKVKLVDIE